MGVAKSVASSTASGVAGILKLYHPRNIREKGILWSAGIGVVTLAVIAFILSIYWGREPGFFDVRVNALEMAEQDETKMVIGYVTSATIVRVAETLLNKPGGYLSNDIMPPGVLMDNIPNWEFGALVQLRDMSRAMRNDFSRSRTQSVEDRDLQIAEPQFHFDSESWILPSTEAEYQKGIDAMRSYMRRLTDPNNPDAQFFARADNLRAYLTMANSRLGSLVQRLGASVGQQRFDINLAGERVAEQSTPTPDEQRVQTNWWYIDDVFYEARGASWALLHLFKALEYDLAKPLRDKNAEVPLRQIIRELEGSQDAMWSPVVLNGTGFGFVANHSLVMASYMSRANAAILDLVELLRI